MNQASLRMFDTQTDCPWRTKSNIFLLYDYVHVLKSVRNNWITEKTQQLIFTQSGGNHVAKWSDFKNLYHLEERNLVKMSNLNAKSISLTPIERQKVSTCLKVFCGRTVAALPSHPSLKNENVGDTALFIDITVKFWTV